MPNRGCSVFGMYLDFTSLRRCIDCLKAIGIKSSDVSVLLPDGSILSTLYLVMDPRRLVPARDRKTTSEKRPTENGNRANNGVLPKSLLTLGIPAYELEHCEWRVRNGAILISVRCISPVWPEDVSEIFNQTGAVELSSTFSGKTLPVSPEYPAGPPRRPYDERIHGGASEAASHAAVS